MGRAHLQPKSLLLLALAAASFASGAIGQYLYPGYEASPVDLWFLPVFALLIFWWYRMDTIQTGYRRSPWLNIAVIGIAFLALPYYFFRSRGFKRGALATVGMVGALLLSGLLTLGGQHAMYLGLQS